MKYICSLVLWFLVTSFPILAQQVIKEKTLVVWASPHPLDQRGGSPLSLDDNQSHFDAIVLGEIEPGKWMAGSNNFQRTQKDQEYYSKETSTQNQFVQMAIVYAGKHISIYRNGSAYASYETEGIQEFDSNNLTILFGRRHLEASDDQNSFIGKIKDARIYAQALTQEQLKRLQPGMAGPDPQPWAWWDFSNHGLQDVSRNFTEFQLIGAAFLANGHLVLNGNGASFICRQPPKQANSLSDFKVSSAIIQNTRSFREKLLSDPYRPAYHFCVPEDRGQPGDPNGAFYANGRYHLMYLYNREGSGFSWGHVSSADLLHWRHHPDGIGPGDGDEGCFSGGGFVDSDGTAYLSYWMLWGAKGIGLAKSTDSEYNTWEKLESNPVITSTEWGITALKNHPGDSILIGSADPSNIWKQGGKYYMATGNLLVLNKIGRAADAPENEKGDRLYLFESSDLINWTYLHPFYESDRKWTEASEDNMCPSFLPLPKSPDGGLSSDKHLLLFISHNLGCQYYIGNYQNDHFLPEQHGRMTWIDNSYFAPEALIDGQGRQIMWAWIFDERPEEMKAEYGWTGTYGLPRSLWLNKDGSLGIKPVQELENLRTDEIVLTNFSLPSNKEVDFGNLGLALMEMELVIDPKNADQIEITVCRSEDRKESTKIIFNQGEGLLQVDTRNSSLKFGKKLIESAPFRLNKRELLKLRIFIDRSIIEVYANDRQAIARRIYPTVPGNGIAINAINGNAKLKSVKRWRIHPTNPF